MRRLYQKAAFLHFKRSQRTQDEKHAILQVEGCTERKSSKFYHGKRVAYVYKALNKTKGTNMKCIWGTVNSSLGNNGLVSASFRRNLPPRAMGATVRVMLYPNKTI